LFYLMAVFILNWSTTQFGLGKPLILSLQLLGMFFFAIGILVGGWYAERHRKYTLIIGNVLIVLFGLVFSVLFAPNANSIGLTLCLGLFLMGIIYGPIGTTLGELFPTVVRYTGSSLAFSMAGILGASVAPLLGTYLAQTYGLEAVGVYLSISALVSLGGTLAMKSETPQSL
jgi:MFS family permease